MKRIINLLILTAAVAAFAIPAVAQADECNDDNKGAWYKTFLDNYTKPAPDNKLALDAAKKYIASCGDDPQKAYMQKFVTKYEEGQKNAGTSKACDDALKGKDYSLQMSACKTFLQSNPDNVDVTVMLGVAGLADTKVISESAGYAAKAIQMIEGGKPVKVYPHDQALAYLNWTIGHSKLQSAPADAINDLLKAAKLESDVKKNYALYLEISAAYEAGPRAKYSADYTASLKPDKTESDQSKVILVNLNQVIDNQIDAMARAAALAPADKKKDILTELTALYKYRNKTATDANVTELVANVLSKPIPDVPTPVTSVPSTPSSTPATTNAAGSGGSGTTAPGASKRPRN
jgi:hypothetical protein